MDYLPNVVQATPGSDFTAYAYFSDGAIKLVDVKPLIAEGGVFEQLADPTFFRERLTVLNGTIAWDVSGTRDPYTCIDLDPCKIYKTGRSVKDPLGQIA